MHTRYLNISGVELPDDGQQLHVACCMHKEQVNFLNSNEYSFPVSLTVLFRMETEINFQ